MSLRYNERAAALLDSLKFTYEPEPSWIASGQKPDFFCKRQETEVWVEVKSLPDTDDDARSFRLFDYLRKRSKKVVGHGWGYATASQVADERDAKASLTLVGKAFGHPAYPSSERVLAVIPNDPAYNGQYATFLLRTEKGVVLIVTADSAGRSFSYPSEIEPEFDQHVRVDWADGACVAGKLYEIAEPDRARLFILVHKSEEPFAVNAVGGIDARQVTNRERLRKAVREANRQFKNALVYKQAPTAVFIYQDGPMVSADQAFLAALFGDLQYVFQRTAFEKGSFKFGPNGVLRGEHSSISAVCYFRNEAVPLIVHNPWSSRPLPYRLFGGTEYIPNADGGLDQIGER